MSHRISRLLGLAALTLGGALVSLGGCSAAPEPEPGVEDGSDTRGEGVTGSVSTGTKLVASGNVNLRSGPSTSKSVLRVVPDGAVVTVVASAPSNGFYKIDYDGSVGWSSGKYFTISDDQAPSGDVGAGTILVATANVNLRSGPSTASSILDVVMKGEQVTVADATLQNGYFQVDHDGTVGWSKGSYYAQAGQVDPGDNSDPGSAWSCTGSYATTKVTGGKYYSTSFGCWVDSNGNAHSDSGDNCIPYCLSQAKSDGLCAGMSGPQCERETNWYAADAGRFGCLTRLRVTNVKSGKSAIVVVLDAGPACFVEKKVQAGVLDLSSRVTQYLFGGSVGVGDAAMVKVEEVASSTPLGPE